MNVFCDDGSTAVKLAYYDDKKALITQVIVNSFRLGWKVNPLGGDVFNFTIEGKRYAQDVNSESAVQTTNIEYQYGDMNLMAVHYALLRSGLPVQDIDLVVTLPISEFYHHDGTKNMENIEKKKANLLRPITIQNGELFTINSVMVMPESLPAAFPFLKKGEVSEYETSLVVDLGGTTLDCGAVSGAYESFSKISGDSTIGVSLITEPTLAALKMAGTIVNPSVANKLIEDRYNDTLFNQLVIQRDKIPMVRESIEQAIEQLAALVISHLQRYKSVNRIFLTGGGATLIDPYIRSAYADLGDKVICLDNAQVALVSSMAIINRG